MREYTKAKRSHYFDWWLDQNPLARDIICVHVCVSFLFIFIFFLCRNGRANSSMRDVIEDSTNNSFSGTTWFIQISLQFWLRSNFQSYQMIFITILTIPNTCQYNHPFKHLDDHNWLWKYQQDKVFTKASYNLQRTW